MKNKKPTDLTDYERLRGQIAGNRFDTLLNLETGEEATELAKTAVEEADTLLAALFPEAEKQEA